LRKYFGWFRHFTATQSESQLWSRTLSCPYVEIYITDSVYLSPLHCRLKEVPLNGVR
jgi:hypothetical protein